MKNTVEACMCPRKITHYAQCFGGLGSHDLYGYIIYNKIFILSHIDTLCSYL